MTINALQALVLNGEISANGLEGTGGRSGSGSGGSIWIDAVNFSGNGSITAHGGDGERGGGGGRIALRYEDFTAWGSSIDAFGGSGSEGNGGAGSVYLLNELIDQDYLVFSNGGLDSEPDSTPFAPQNGTSFDVIEIFDANVVALVEVNVNDNLSIGNNGVLSHSVLSPQGIRINTLNLNVDEGGRIDVTGRGYWGGRSGAQGGVSQGQTITGLNGSVSRVGGTHGGSGHSSFGAPNSWYGNVLSPADFGSGGGAGASNESGGNGGGKIFIDASFVSIDGDILANGAPGGGGNAGSGSGGSIHIISSSEITGNGTIQARGGDGEVPGGGGRIALSYTIDAELELPFSVERISAASGDSSPAFRPAGAGTIVLHNQNLSRPSLRISNDNLSAQGDSTLYPSTPSDFDMVLLTDYARVMSTTPIAAQSLEMRNSASLTHPPSYEAGLTIEVGSLLVDGSSAIDLVGRGYWGGRSGTQFATATGQTFPGLDGSPNRVGGSHGGLGDTTFGTPNEVYGSDVAPVTLGSGGGSGSSNEPGGSGGGILRINAFAMTIDGFISADGHPGIGGQAGGGAGGSIWMSVFGTIDGVGTISASGGGGDIPGGGGRIAIYYNDLVISQESILVDSGGASAGIGTLVIEENPPMFRPPADRESVAAPTVLRITSMVVHEDGTVTFTCEGDNGVPVTIEASPLPDGGYQPLPTERDPTLRARPPFIPNVQFFRLNVEPSDAP
jgi:large repetitive protein